MAGKKEKGKSSGNTDLKLDEIDTAAHISSIENDPMPTVHVSKSNIAEMKTALDDSLKKHLESLSFTPSLFNPTVHLALGYTSVIFSLGSVLYSLRVEFEDSKPVLWVGVIGYALFQSVLWAWKRWIEKGEIFKGRRKRVVKRIETDHIQIMTSTNFNPTPMPAITFSPHTRPSSPNLASSSPTSSSPTSLSPVTSHSSDQPSSHPIPPSSPSKESLTFTPSSIPSSVGSKDRGPTYLVHVTLSTTSNNGKSLLRKSRVVAGRGVGELVDVNGGVEEGEVARWLNGLLSDAGLAGAEETDGMKEE